MRCLHDLLIPHTSAIVLDSATPVNINLSCLAEALVQDHCHMIICMP